METQLLTGAEQDALGASVAVLPGQGIAVGAIGSTQSGAQAGGVYIADWAGTESAVISTEPLFIAGPSAGDWFGYALGVSTDLGDDGVADIIVGAPQFGSEGSGYAALIIDGDLSHRLYGDLSGETAGSSVAALDGWSAPVVAVGRPLASAAAGNQAGAVSLMALHGDGREPTGIASVSGSSEGAWLGTSMSVGDVNADGVDDLVVGAEASSDGGFLAGAAYVLIGPVSGSLTAADADFSLVGVEQYAGQAGHSVSATGDANGDGSDDVVVSAISGLVGGESRSFVALFTDLSDLGSSQLVSDGQAVYIGTEEYSTASVGRRVEMSPDLSGDDAAEMVASDPDAHGTGAVYVLMSPHEGTHLVCSSAEVKGAGGDFGWAIAGVVDSGAGPMLLVGAPFFDGDSGPASGAVFSIRPD